MDIIFAHAKGSLPDNLEPLLVYTNLYSIHKSLLGIAMRCELQYFFKSAGNDYLN